MGKSSKDKRDAYYRLAKEQGWRARSAFKLLQLDESFNLFDGVTRVVDLCAAPGSWSQVLSRVLIQGERVGRAAWEDKRYLDLLRQHAAAAAAATSLTGDATITTPAVPTEPPTEPPRRPRPNVKIVAIDLQPMAPLPGITCLKADITHPSTVPLLLRALDLDDSTSSTDPDAGPDARPDAAADDDAAHHPVDLVLSDGAPDVTGLHDLDIYVQAQLLWAALHLALRVLKPGGKFVAKIFRVKDVDALYAQLKTLFDSVTVAKPRSSRASSVEAFVVCTGFRAPKGLRAGLERGEGLEGAKVGMEGNAGVGGEVGRKTVREDRVTELYFGEEEDEKASPMGKDRWIAPFLACGDLSAFDADASHKVPEGHVSLDPVQPPTAPPYRRALEERKKMGGAYGKTKLGSVG